VKSTIHWVSAAHALEAEVQAEAEELPTEPEIAESLREPGNRLTSLEVARLQGNGEAAEVPDIR